MRFNVKVWEEEYKNALGSSVQIFLCSNHKSFLPAFITLQPFNKHCSSYFSMITYKQKPLPKLCLPARVKATIDNASPEAEHQDELAAERLCQRVVLFRGSERQPTFLALREYLVGLHAQKALTTCLSLCVPGAQDDGTLPFKTCAVGYDTSSERMLGRTGLFLTSTFRGLDTVRQLEHATTLHAPFLLIEDASKLSDESMNTTLPAPWHDEDFWVDIKPYIISGFSKTGVERYRKGSYSLKHLCFFYRLFCNESSTDLHVMWQYMGEDGSARHHMALVDTFDLNDLHGASKLLSWIDSIFKWASSKRLDELDFLGRFADHLTTPRATKEAEGSKVVIEGGLMTAQPEFLRSRAKESGGQTYPDSRTVQPSVVPTVETTGDKNPSSTNEPPDPYDSLTAKSPSKSRVLEDWSSQSFLEFALSIDPAKPFSFSATEPDNSSDKSEVLSLKEETEESAVLKSSPADAEGGVASLDRQAPPPEPLSALEPHKEHEEANTVKIVRDPESGSQTLSSGIAIAKMESSSPIPAARPESDAERPPAPHNVLDTPIKRSGQSELLNPPPSGPNKKLLLPLSEALQEESPSQGGVNVYSPLAKLSFEPVTKEFLQLKLGEFQVSIRQGLQETVAKTISKVMAEEISLHRTFDVLRARVDDCVEQQLAVDVTLQRSEKTMQQSLIDIHQANAAFHVGLAADMVLLARKNDVLDSHARLEMSLSTNLRRLREENAETTVFLRRQFTSIHDCLLDKEGPKPKDRLADIQSNLEQALHDLARRLGGIEETQAYLVEHANQLSERRRTGRLVSVCYFIGIAAILIGIGAGLI